MRNDNTFGLHFVLRTANTVREKLPVYARIVVNSTRCELSLKCYVRKDQWNSMRGAAKPLTNELKQLNSYLEQIRAKIVKHYRALQLDDVTITAERVKNAYLGKNLRQSNYTLLQTVAEHNSHMPALLRPGTIKNYYTTEKYLKAFIAKQIITKDVALKDLNYEFISRFENFVRSNAIKQNDPCTNNGAMKHMERLKKIIAWAQKNEWIDKNPFANFKLKFNRYERDFLSEPELRAIEQFEFEQPELEKVRDLFIFSCYTGLPYIDLVNLKPGEIVNSIDGTKWIKTSREKTGTTMNIPLLQHVVPLIDKYTEDASAIINKTVFPKISNQDVNRHLKIIAEICGIKKYLTFHLARHTFATTVTLMNGVPIESISKMMGHTKLSTTMIYAKVTTLKISKDMEELQRKLKRDTQKDHSAAIDKIATNVDKPQYISNQ